MCIRRYLRLALRAAPAAVDAHNDVQWNLASACMRLLPNGIWRAAPARRRWSPLPSGCRWLAGGGGRMREGAERGGTRFPSDFAPVWSRTQPRMGFRVTGGTGSSPGGVTRDRKPPDSLMVPGASCFDWTRLAAYGRRPTRQAPGHFGRRLGKRRRNDRRRSSASITGKVRVDRFSVLDRFFGGTLIARQRGPPGRTT
jgi:hypothetical protein